MKIAPTCIFFFLYTITVGVKSQTIISQELTYVALHSQQTYHNNTLGTYTLAIAYQLKENLINLLGYLMHQPTVRIERKWYVYFSELQGALAVNDIDVFKIIPVLPRIINSNLNEQFTAILDSLTPSSGMEGFKCHFKCSSDIWHQEQPNTNIDLTYILGHIGYNPIFTGIVDISQGKTLGQLQDISNKIIEGVPGSSKDDTEALALFSPILVQILRDITNNNICLTERLLGYMLKFYPWPRHDTDLDVALGKLVIKFTDNKEDLIHCKLFLHQLNHLALKPIELLETVMDKILESFCPTIIKTPAKIIRDAIQAKLTIPDYKNIKRGNYVELLQLSKLLEVINHQNYPVEIVLAADRVQDYLDKVLPYLDIENFAVYDYHTPEEMLAAFLNFILQKTPHVNTVIKSSINAIRIYLKFVRTPQVINLDLLVSLTDAWLAPDLNDDIKEEVMELRVFLLDEGAAIRAVFDRLGERRCYDVFACYQQAVSILMTDQRFKSTSDYFVLPQCILNRFFNGQMIAKIERTNLRSLLEIVTYQTYKREMVLSANRIRDYISDGKDLLPDFDNGVYCTKHESLLAYLEQITKSTNFPREVYDSMRAIIPTISFKVKQIRQMNIRVMTEITKAFHAPDSDEAIVHAMTKIDAFMSNNELVLDQHLDRMDPNKCIEVLACYNNIADYLNQFPIGHKFPFFRPFSPELYILNLGFDLSSMSVLKVLKVVKALMENLLSEHNELEAAILYVAQTANQVDSYFQAVNCVDKQVMPCFEQILNSLKINQPRLKVKVNIYQYLLTPATCDRRYCQWINYNEVGSVILNPLLEYIKDLLDNLSRNVRSLHLQIDIIEIVEYLKTENVDFALTTFKIKQYPTESDKMAGFLSVMMQDSSVDQGMMVTLQNVIDYLSTGRNPQYITLNTIKAIVKILGTMTTQNILCSMERKLLLVLSVPERAYGLLKAMRVDCTDLNTCLTTLEDQLHENMNQQLAPVILQIIKPEVCALVQCSWTQGKFKYDNNKYITLRDTIIFLLSQIKDKPDIPLIIKLLSESLTKNERLTYFIHFISPEEIDGIQNAPDILIDFLKIFEGKYLLTPELRPSIKYLLIFLMTREVPTNLNHDVLINLLQIISDDTKNDMVRSQIATLQNLLAENMGPVNAELIKLHIECYTVETCIRNIYEKLQKTNLPNDKIVSLLNSVLLAPTCTKAHCPHKISVSKQEVDAFVKFITSKIDLLKDAPNTPYHIIMDLEQAKKYVIAKGPDLATSELVYKKNEPDILTDVLASVMNQDSRLPSDVSLSLSNILSYYKDNLTPTYLQMQHLTQMVHNLQSQTLDVNVQNALNKVLENLEVHAPEVNQLLLETPVNCTMFKTCLESLYVKIVGDVQNPVTAAVLDIFQPAGCNDFTCPWLQDFVSKQIDTIKNDVHNQIIQMVQHENIPMQLQFDFQNLQHWITNQNLDGIYGNLGSQMNGKLVTFLEELGPNIVTTFDVGESVNNILNYMNHGFSPNRIDINTLKALNEVLMNSTNDWLVKKEMQDALKSLSLYEENVKQLLNKLPVTCTVMDECLQNIYLNLQDHKNNPMSLLIKQLLFPSTCSKVSCPWILEESTETSLNKLQTIKDMIQHILDREAVPLIVRLKLEDIKEYLTLENCRDALAQVDTKNSNVLPEFLQKLAESPSTNPVIRNQINSIINFLNLGQAPQTLSFTDFCGLVKQIQLKVDDALGQLDINQLLLKVNRYPQEIDQLLQSCPVDCTQMNMCLDTLKDCMSYSTNKSPQSATVLDILQPTHCTDMDFVQAQRYGCKYEISQVNQFGNLPANKPFHPNQIVIFLNTPTGPRSILLDLDNPDVVKSLLNLPKPDGKNQQVIVLEVPDGYGNVKRISLDLNDKGTTDRLTDLPFSLDRPTLEFSQMNSIVVYVQNDNGKYVPIKLDLTQANVRDVLNQISKYQIPNGKLPELTMIDFDGNKKTVAIDVNNNALWKLLLKTSSDTIYCDVPLLIDYPGYYGDAWRSVLVTGYDKIAIKSIQNLPAVDNVNQATPAICATGGMLQLTFNVYEPITQSVLNNIRPQLPIITTYETKYVLITIPDRFGYLIPYKVDLTNPKVLKALSRLSRKWMTQGEPTFVIETQQESVPVYLNFDLPIATTTFQEEMRRIEQAIQPTDQKPKLIVLENPETKEKILLSADDHKVVMALQDIARNSVRTPNSVIVTVEVNGNTIEVPIDTHNPFLMQYLTQLMHNTLQPIQPTTIYGEDGRQFQVMAVPGPGGIRPIIFEQSQKNFEIFQQINNQQMPNRPDHGQMMPGYPAPGYPGSGDKGPGHHWPDRPDHGQMMPGYPGPGDRGPGHHRPNRPDHHHWPGRPDHGQMTPGYPGPGDNGPNDLIASFMTDFSSTFGIDFEGFPGFPPLNIDFSDDGIWQSIDMLEEVNINGVATDSQKDSLTTNTANILSLTVTDESGRQKVMCFDMKNQNVYEGFRDSCKDITGAGSQVVVTRPDGQQEILYCNLYDIRTVNDLRHVSVSEKEKLSPESVAIISLPDSTGRIHSFILDLTNENVIMALKQYSLTANPNSDNKVGIVYKDKADNNQLIVIDMNQVTLNDMRHLASYSPSSMVPIQTTIDGNKILVTTYPREDGSTGSLLLNLTDSRTQDILAAMSEPGNPLATKIIVEDNQNNKIELFIDFGKSKNAESLSDLPFNPPSFPVPLVLSQGSGVVTVDYTDEHGKRQTVSFNVTDAKTMASMPTSHNAPKFSVMTADGKQITIQVDTKDELITRVGETMNKPDKNSLVVLQPEGGRAILLDLSNQEIADAVIELQSPYPTSTSLIVPDSDGRQHLIYLDLKSYAVVDALNQLQKKNPTNIVPTVIPTTEEGHQLLVFTVPLDDKTPKSVVVDNKDTNTLHKLIALSDNSNPNAKLIIFTDDKGVALPLYLDLHDPRVRQVLSEADQSVNLPNSVLTNPGDQPSKYIDIPTNINNEVLKCDITNPQILSNLKSISIQNYGKGGTIFSIIEPTTRRPITLTLNVHEPSTQNMLYNLCMEVVIQPSPDRLFVTMVPHNGIVKPIILDMDNEQTKAIMQSLNQDIPTKGTSLVQYVDDNGKLQVLKIDFTDEKTQQALKWLNEQNPKMIAPTLVTKSDGSKALIFSVNDNNRPTNIILNVDNANVLNKLKEISSPEGINTTPISFIDSNGKYHTFNLDLNNPRVVDALKQLTNEVMVDRPLMVAPVIDASSANSIAVWDKNGQVQILQVDFNNSKTMSQIEGFGTGKKGDLQIQVTDGNRTYSIFVDTSNEKVVSNLEGLSTKQEIRPNPGSLIIVPLTDENRPLVLNTNNDHVVKTLKEISMNTPLNNATHIFTIMDKDQKVLIKLNMDDQKVRNIVQNLANLTPTNLQPVELVGPDGRPLVFITMTDQNKKPHQFVLDLNDQRVIQQILPLDKRFPRDPFVIDFHDLQGNPQSLTLDKSRHDIIDMLYRGQEATKLPVQAMKNKPTEQSKEDNLILPIEQENGNHLLYTFDTTKPAIVQQIIGLNSKDFSKPGLIVYVTDEFGKTRPVRLDLQDDRIVNALQELADDISAEYTQKTAIVIMIVNDRGQKEVIILDKDLDGVIHNLKEALANNNPSPDRPISILNIMDKDGNTYEIKLSPFDQRTNEILRQIQKRFTPKVIKPFPVKTPNGELPLIVFAVKDRDNNSIVFVLDQNQPEVVDTIRRLAVPKRPGTVAIPFTNIDGSIDEVHIDIENPETIKTLLYLTQLAPMLDTPILSPSRTFVIEVTDEDGNVVKLQFDTKDGNVVLTLIEISKNVHPQSPHYVGLISDQYGNAIPIRLDINNPDTVQKLIKLAQRFIYPKPVKVIPSSGFIPLQIFDILLGVFSFPITIDCNNASVIAKIQQKQQRLKPGVTPIRIMACENQVPILIDLDDSDLPVFLTGVSVLSSIMLNPNVVIPSDGKLPIVSMLVEQDYGQASICLDFNQLDVVRMLLPLQPMYKDGVTTFFYEEQNSNKKYPITLDLKNPQTLQVMKQVTTRCQVRLVPIIYRQPILEIVFGNEVFKLDFNNPVVKQALEDIGRHKQPLTGHEVYIELPNRGNLPMAIFIDLQRHQQLLRELTMFCPPPIVTVIPPRFIKVVPCFATILPPNGVAPLAVIHVKEIGPICLDINNPTVRSQLMNLINGPEPKSPTYFMIPNLAGDIFVLKVDLTDMNTVNLLITLAQSCDVLFEPTDQSTNVLLIRLPKRPVRLDINRPEVFDALMKLSKPRPTPTTYTIYIPKKPQFTMFLIDVSDVQTQEELYAVEKPKLDPFLFELKYQDLDSAVWKMVIDVNSDEVMNKLVEFSKQTTTGIPADATVITVKMMSPQGRSFDIKLDKTNPQTLEFLKDLTRVSTNAEPELLIPAKPKQIQMIEVEDSSGTPIHISIDMNNVNVLAKLQAIADAQASGVEKTTITLVTPDGTKLSFSLDLKDLMTLENLQKLSVESERHIPAKLKFVKQPGKKKIPILSSFPVSAPFVGTFTVTVDVSRIEIVEQLRLLAREFIPGRSESQVLLKDNLGKEIFLKLDLTNSTTVYRLVMITIDSTGQNPTGIEPLEILNHVTYVPEVMTIEVPDGFEILPISFDRSLAQVVTVIKGQYVEGNTKGTSVELIENGVGVNVILDTTNQKVLAALRSVQIQTILPKVAMQMTQLITIIFLRTDSSRYIPVILDLSNKETVLHLLSIIKIGGKVTGHETYLEIRDEYGQYITIGVDLSNIQILNTLLGMAADIDVIEIDATRIPYLTMCFPDSDRHQCVKIKLKPSAIQELMDLPKGNNILKFRIRDALQKQVELDIDPTAPRIVGLIASTEHAAMVLKPFTTNMFIVYHSDQDEATPIYVDTTSQKTLELLQDLELRYTKSSPMAVVRYTVEHMMQFFAFTIDLETIDLFMEITATVSGHAIVKQKLTQRTTIYIPSNNNNGQNIEIVLDMANKDVVQGLKEISDSFDPSASPTLINLEDAYGYPLQLKIDIYNQDTIGRLIQLSNKQVF